MEVRKQRHLGWEKWKNVCFIYYIVYYYCSIRHSSRKNLSSATQTIKLTSTQTNIRSRGKSLSEKYDCDAQSANSKHSNTILIKLIIDNSHIRISNRKSWIIKLLLFLATFLHDKPLVFFLLTCRCFRSAIAIRDNVTISHFILDQQVRLKVFFWFQNGQITWDPAEKNTLSLIGFFLFQKCTFW